MLGQVIVDFGTGWMCSNEAAVVTERDPIRDLGGKITATKHTTVVRAMAPFTAQGSPQSGDPVQLVFMPEGTGTKIGYSAFIKSLNEGMAIFGLGPEIRETQDIIKKIGGYNNGK